METDTLVVKMNAPTRALLAVPTNAKGTITPALLSLHWPGHGVQAPGPLWLLVESKTTAHIHSATTLDKSGVSDSPEMLTYTGQDSTKNCYSL